MARPRLTAIFRDCLAVSLLLLSLSACAILQGTPDEPPQTAGGISEKTTGKSNGYPQRSGTRRSSRVDIERLERATPTSSGIELIWEIPKEPVKSFVVNYGYERDRLDFHVRLDSDSLQRVRHAQHGEVYRYVLDSVPGDRSIFVSIVSVVGGKPAEPSNVVEVRPSEGGSRFREDGAMAPQA